MSLDDWRAFGEDTSGRSELQEGVLIVSPRPVPRHQLELLRRYGRPTGLSKLSHRQLATVVTKYAHCRRAELVEAVEKALDEQSAMVPGTAGVEAVIPKLVEALSGLRAQRADAAARIEEMLTAHPLRKVLTSIPGIGVRTAATILVEVGDVSRFPTSGHRPPTQASHPSPDNPAAPSAVSTASWQQSPQKSAVPVLLRRARRSRIPDLLPAEAIRRKAA